MSFLERLHVPETKSAILSTGCKCSAIWRPGTIFEFEFGRSERCDSTCIFTEIPDCDLSAPDGAREVLSIGGKGEMTDALEADPPILAYLSIRIPEDDRAIL